VVTVRLSVRQGDIWLADLGEPAGSVAGYVRPVVIVQGNLVNDSRLRSYLAIPVTGNLRHGKIPTNVTLPAKQTGLDRVSVAQPTLTLAVDETQLLERLGAVSAPQLRQLFACLDVALGRA
jgi:mRNA interferase MazF